jgi:hypothetical protein
MVVVESLTAALPKWVAGTYLTEVDRSTSYLKIAFEACISPLKDIIQVLLKTFTSPRGAGFWDVL